jgi:hypothetical protein
VPDPNANADRCLHYNAFSNEDVGRESDGRAAQRDLDQSADSNTYTGPDSHGDKQAFHLHRHINPTITDVDASNWLSHASSSDKHGSRLYTVFFDACPFSDVCCAVGNG